MKNIDYVEKIKESAKNIDFDETAKRIFEEYIDFVQDGAKEIYRKIQKLPKNNFYNENEIKVEKYVNKIFAGHMNNGIGQSSYHEYNRYSEYKAELNSVVVTGLGSSVINTAIIENSENYVKQLFNLAQSVGTNIKLKYPQNEKHYHFFFETDIGIVCCLDTNKRFEYFQQILYRYMYYNLMVYDKRIRCNNKKEKIKELKNINQKTKNLYKHLKSFFDNTNFIYAILTYLDTDEKIDLYNLCIKKNESWLGHEYMNDIITYISTAYYLYENGCPKKPTFICDRIDEFTRTPLGKKLYKKLLKMIGNRNSASCSISYIKTEEEKQGALDFIESVKDDYLLSKAYCEIIYLKRCYRAGKKDQAIEHYNRVIQYMTPNYKPFIELRDKMIKGEKI